jgi:inhibitor of KinA sporulation pathway (predicted exonuclease)
MIVNECQKYNIEYPFNRHIDLKTVFGVLFGLKKSISVERAIESLGLKFEGRPHSGKDDALNIARILKNLSSRVQKQRD